MRSLSLAMLLLSFAGLANGQTVSIQGSGEQAVTLLNTNGGHISIFVGNGTNANGSPATLLIFDFATANPDGTTTDISGFGVIPSGTFTVQGPFRMSLSVDTSQVAGFTNMTCIISASGTACSPSQGGLVQVAWTGNRITSVADTFHLDTTTGPVTQHFDNRGIGDSANAQGSILGFVFNATGSGMDTFISTNHSHTITITRN